MKKNCFYIKIYDGINLTEAKIILKDKYNKIVFEEKTDKFGKVKIPICNNEIYKLFVFSKTKILIGSLIANKEKVYCININKDSIENKKQLVTVLLVDAYYQNLKIKKGEMILWQETLSK